MTGLIIGSVAALVTFGIGWAVYQLALNDIFFTFVKEGTAKAVVVNGQFREMLMSLEGHRFQGAGSDWKSADDWSVVEDSSCRPGRFGGLRWVGIYPFARVHLYKFSWASVTRGDNGADKISAHNDETLENIYLKRDVYAFPLKGVELVGGIPVDLVILLDLHVVNPFKALFRVERWLEATQNITGAEIRTEIGTISYEDLVADREGANERVRGILRGVQHSNSTEILNDFGIKILKIHIHSFDPSNEAIREITLRRITAEKEGEAEVAKATKDAEAARLRASGQADAFRKITETVLSFGKPGVELERLRTLREAKANITVVTPGLGVTPFVNAGGAGTSSRRNQEPDGGDQ